jgi:hypothetical protein
LTAKVLLGRAATSPVPEGMRFRPLPSARFLGPFRWQGWDDSSLPGPLTLATCAVVAQLVLAVQHACRPGSRARAAVTAHACRSMQQPHVLAQSTIPSKLHFTGRAMPRPTESHFVLGAESSPSACLCVLDVLRNVLRNGACRSAGWGMSSSARAQSRPSDGPP